MKSYRKKGVIKSVQFNRKGYEGLMKDPKKLAEQSSEMRNILKRVKKTQNGYFCASSAGMRPISDNSFLCFDEGRVFTMSEKDFLGKFEEVLDGGEDDKVKGMQDALEAQKFELEEAIDALNKKTQELDELNTKIDKAQKDTQSTDKPNPGPPKSK